MAKVDRGNLLVWQALKLYLPPGTVLTSVYRSAQDQLDIIVRHAKKRGYKFAKEPTVEDKASWEDALKLIRSPPDPMQVAAPGRSLHQRALAYDLSGHNIDEIAAAVRKAVAEGRIKLLRGSRNNPRIENVKGQRCVHVEIEGAVLDFEPFEWDPRPPPDWA